MPARSFGYSEVEERLQEIRRRLNLLAVQHAAYACVSAILLLAAGLKLLEIYAGPLAYRLAYWPTIAAVLAALLLGARSALRQLASVESAARLADRRAHLKDRLATLYAHGRFRSSSRLVDVVFSDVLNHAPRWRVSALGVRRVPRTAYALALSATLLVATQFLEGPPESKPAPAPHPQHLQSPVAEQDAPPKPAREHTMHVSASMASNAGATGTSSRRGDGAGSGSKGQLSPGGDQGSQAAAAGGGNVTGLLAKADVGGGRIANDGRAQPPGQVGGGSKAGGTDPSDEENARDRHPSARGAPSPDGLERNPGKDRDADAARTNDPPAHPEAGVASEGSRSGRGGKGAEAGGLFGSHGSEADGKGAPRSFALRLTRSTTANIQMDPQGKGEPVSAAGMGSGGNAALPGGAEQEAPDGALHRAEVSPEHEAILSRIFRRD